MIKTEELELLCEEISEFELDLDLIFERYRKAEGSHIMEIKEPYKHLSRFCDIHVSYALEDIVLGHPEWKARMDPIVDGNETGDYSFVGNNYRNIWVNFKSNGKTIAEYDNVVLLDDLPVVFEAKSGWIDNREKIFKCEGYQSLRPIREFFRSEVGYVILVPCDVYEYRKDQSFIVEFTNRMGIFSPLNFDRKSFRRNVREKILDNGIPWG